MGGALFTTSMLFYIIVTCSGRASNRVLTVIWVGALSRHRVAVELINA